MPSIEARVLARMEAVFARCPELFRFSVRDRSGLPITSTPTKLEEVYAAIAAAIAAAVSSWPEARDLLPGKTFVRYLH